MVEEYLPAYCLENEDYERESRVKAPIKTAPVQD
jgi:hypothetical protein